MPNPRTCALQGAQHYLLFSVRSLPEIRERTVYHKVWIHRPYRICTRIHICVLFGSYARLRVGEDERTGDDRIRNGRCRAGHLHAFL